MTYIIVSILFLIIAFIANSQMDKITYQPKGAWLQNDFWLTIDYTGKSWLLKVPFSFLSNGWHLCKGIQTYSYLMSFSFLVCNYYGINFYYALFINIIPYTIGGIIWEMFYNLTQEK